MVKIQKKLASLKTAIIQNLRIAAWFLPFGPFVGLFVCKALFDMDLMALLDFNMIVSFGITTILLEVVSLLILKALHPNRMNKKWLNWLLQGSGSQVNDALEDLKSIENFQTEPTK